MASEMQDNSPRGLTLFAPPGVQDQWPPYKADRTRTTKRRPARGPELRVCVLGSGSGGNCTVVQVTSGGQITTMLIDIGFGPRTTARRLAMAGLTLADVDHILLTHLDQDHFRKSWPRTLADLPATLHLHHWHLPQFMAMDRDRHLRGSDRVMPFTSERIMLGDYVAVTPHRLQHDRQGTIGYRIDAVNTALGYATDLGHAPPGLIDLFAGVDLLCLESNYDHFMTIHSSRPSYVNRRNISDSGHLSNDQAFDAVCAIDDRTPGIAPRRVLLMHRSRQCNHPMKVLRTFEKRPTLAGRIVLTEQRKRTRWFGITPRKAVIRHQLTLGYGAAS